MPRHFAPLRAAGSCLFLAAASVLLGSCSNNQAQPQFGGFSSLVADPSNILKDEPAPIRPNSHMDPVQERTGAFNVRWVEDLEKTSTNHEPDPDDQPRKR